MTLKGIINSIYQASDEALMYDMRRNFLKLSKKLFKADGAAFFMASNGSHDCKSPDIKKLDFTSAVTSGLDTRYMKPYMEYYYRHDPFLEVIGSNEICATDSIFPSGWRRNSEYYNDFLKPQSMAHEMIICVRSGSRLFGKIGMFRAENRRGFEKADMDNAKLIAKHLAYVMKNVSTCAGHINNGDTVNELNNCPFMGIILLDSNLKLSYSNEVAERICNQISGARSYIRNNGSGITIPAEVIMDCEQIRLNYLSGNTPPQFFRVSCVSVSENRKYMFRSYLNMHGQGGKPVYIVMVEDSTALQEFREKDAVAKYGLTRKETGICRLVKEGLTNKEIANALCVNLCTVETHIRNIFKKTEVTNRTGLIRLLD